MLELALVAIFMAFVGLLAVGGLLASEWFYAQAWDKAPVNDVSNCMCGESGYQDEKNT